MGCTPLVNKDKQIVGFVCDMGGYMGAEIAYWQNNLDEYKKVFIEYLNRCTGIGELEATLECEVWVETIGIDEISTPEMDADNCIENWSHE